ncbi:MAG: type II/IV secretion system protein [Myxococcales bacterium]|nr:type II/IV secretion system protein [Myxococcales bacterium]
MRRRAGEFSVEYVLDVLCKRGLLREEQRRLVLAREGAQRQKLAREAGSGPRRRDLSPIEIVASFDFPDPKKRPEVVDQDKIVSVIAEEVGVAFRRIDRLRLDAALITRTLSLPYARKHGVIALERGDRSLVMAVTNPFDDALVDELVELTKSDITRVLCTPSDVFRSITEVYGFRSSIRDAQRDLGARSAQGTLENLVSLAAGEQLEAASAPIVSAVDYLLNYAFDHRASDVHIEPHREETAVRMRIDGILHVVYRVPRVLHEALTNRVKVMARMDIASRRPQDGRIRLQRGDAELDLRVSTLPTAFGDKVVIRVLDPAMFLKDLAELGFLEDEQPTFERWLARPTGLILVCGPTGSGKTTTLYSALRAVSSPEVNITTIEDPIEVVYEEFNQVSANAKTGTQFGEALRHILRQDPDVILIGEIRDEETAQEAVQAALTGHLVLSTLHTNHSVGAVARLIDLKVPPFLVAETLVGVLAQRLVRRVCHACGEDVVLTPDELGELGVTHPDEYAGRLVARRGVGCPRCRQTGYFGRGGIYELFQVNGRMRELIAEGAAPEALSRAARQDGLRSLREHALRKVAIGLTTLEEALRVTADSEGVR